tara:strand:+ start:304 stop:495 length:192 start_codon:yes stop_codon:yes gene_type:complete
VRRRRRRTRRVVSCLIKVSANLAEGIQVDLHSRLAVADIPAAGEGNPTAADILAVLLMDKVRI